MKSVSYSLMSAITPYVLVNKDEGIKRSLKQMGGMVVFSASALVGTIETLIYGLLTFLAKSGHFLLLKNSSLSLKLDHHVLQPLITRSFMAAGSTAIAASRIMTNLQGPESVARTDAAIKQKINSIASAPLIKNIQHIHLNGFDVAPTPTPTKKIEMKPHTPTPIPAKWNIDRKHVLIGAGLLISGVIIYTLWQNYFSEALIKFPAPPLNPDPKLVDIPSTQLNGFNPIPSQQANMSCTLATEPAPILPQQESTPFTPASEPDLILPKPQIKPIYVLAKQSQALMSYPVVWKNFSLLNEVFKTKSPHRQIDVNEAPLFSQEPAVLETTIPTSVPITPVEPFNPSLLGSPVNSSTVIICALPIIGVACYAIKKLSTLNLVSQLEGVLFESNAPEPEHPAARSPMPPPASQPFTEPKPSEGSREPEQPATTSPIPRSTSQAFPEPKPSEGSREPEQPATTSPIPRSTSQAFPEPKPSEGSREPEQPAATSPIPRSTSQAFPEPKPSERGAQELEKPAHTSPALRSASQTFTEPKPSEDAQKPEQLAAASPMPRSDSQTFTEPELSEGAPELVLKLPKAATGSSAASGPSPSKPSAPSASTNHPPEGLSSSLGSLPRGALSRTTLTLLESILFEPAPLEPEKPVVTSKLQRPSSSRALKLPETTTEIGSLISSSSSLPSPSRSPAPSASTKPSPKNSTSMLRSLLNQFYQLRGFTARIEDSSEKPNLLERIVFEPTTTDGEDGLKQITFVSNPEKLLQQQVEDSFEHSTTKPNDLIVRVGQNFEKPPVIPTVLELGTVPVARYELRSCIFTAEKDLSTEHYIGLLKDALGDWYLIDDTITYRWEKREKKWKNIANNSTESPYTEPPKQYLNKRSHMLHYKASDVSRYSTPVKRDDSKKSSSKNGK